MRSDYDRFFSLQRSNSLVNWSLDTAAQSLALATATAKPAIFALNGPIMTIDQLLCKGIDIVEQRVPAVHLSPNLVSAHSTVTFSAKTYSYICVDILSRTYTHANILLCI